MPDGRILVIGASAGGVAALKTLVGDLPEDLAAAVFIVLHVPAGSISRLPEILNKQRRLHAADGERIRPGRIYVAPPDHHLLVEDGAVRVIRGPKENHQRPAVDPLFRSAALAHGPAVIGVVLTGALDDGTSGLKTVKRYGGIAIVQDPADAETPDMPRSALLHVDRLLPAPQGDCWAARGARLSAGPRGCRLTRRGNLGGGGPGARRRAGVRGATGCAVGVHLPGVLGLVVGAG